VTSHFPQELCIVRNLIMDHMPRNLAFTGIVLHPYVIKFCDACYILGRVCIVIMCFFVGGQHWGYGRYGRGRENYSGGAKNTHKRFNTNDYSGNYNKYTYIHECPYF
jgi:hypothetical protein